MVVWRVLVAVGLLSLFAVLATGASGGSTGPSAAPSTGYVYWGNGSGIGRASLDGTGVDPSFISADGPTLAVAVGANYIYWTRVDLNDSSVRIGRANLDGTGVNQSLINLGIADGPASGIAADGNYIYWGDWVLGGAIGRANLDGTGVNPSFITSGWEEGVAADGNYVYWVAGRGGLGRANVDGTDVHENFITGVGGPLNVAVDGSHVYWVARTDSETAIGRANPDGTDVDTSLINLGDPFKSEVVSGLAVDGDSIFWGDNGGINRANLDGSCAAPFISQETGVGGVAVTPGVTAPPLKYTVTYAGNHATGGSPPTDAAGPYTCRANVTVLGTGSLTRTGYVFNGWGTEPAGSGTGQYRAGSTFSMPASNVTLYAQWARKLSSAGTTACNGTVTGTGVALTVPAFAHCTILPGTRVKTTIVVKPNGSLDAKGVTIGGNLTMSGASIATVCGSKIGGAITASVGSFTLGGPACAGNKVSGSMAVKQTHGSNVWVWHNTVKKSLTLKYLSGATNSIVSNTISGQLLVSYSGPPVEVTKNHAASALCVGNKGQTGSGNVATGKNTCPH